MLTQSPVQAAAERLHDNAGMLDLPVLIMLHNRIRDIVKEYSLQSAEWLRKISH